MSQATLDTPSQPNVRQETDRSVLRMPGVPSWFAPLAIICLGFAIRVYGFDRLSLWLDEIYVVDYARLPWRDVFGFEGAYDNHPPLYFVLVKLTSLVSSEVNGLRYLSIVTGTLTILVVYALTLRLVNRNAAMLASLILALSPLHVWYSQEGRMYAPTTLTIAISYYTLIRFLERGSPRWGIGYGATLVIAMYLDYSALYALAPQAFVVLALVWRNWRRLRSWVAVVAGAGLLYLPWIREILTTIDTIEERDFLFVTWPKIASSFFTVIGLPGEAGYYWGFVPMPWTEWPEARPVLIAMVATVLLLGTVTLRGRYLPALIVGVALLFGTIATAALVSYFVSPGYADRTVSYGVIGWAILAGSVAFGRVPNGGKTIALAGVAFLFACSLAALQSIYADGGKEDYRGLARQAAIGDSFGFPLYADWLNATALTTYQPSLEVSPSSDLQLSPAMWLSYSENVWVDTGADETQAMLRDRGYERVMHLPFFPLLRLDLYMHRQAAIGTEVDLPPWRAILSDGRLGSAWEYIPEQTALVEDEERTSMLVYSAADRYEPVELILPAEPGHLYLTEIDAKIQLPVGIVYISLQCESADGEATGSSSAEYDGEETDGSWRTIRVGVICEEETSRLHIVYGNTGLGAVELRNPRLSDASPADRVVMDQSRSGRWPGWGTP
jgi:4-amino-4-deoxy-L-arabinose transferase-like glycosyltransferase